jgi:hypothetical protein
VERLELCRVPWVARLLEEVALELLRRARSGALVARVVGFRVAELAVLRELEERGEVAVAAGRLLLRADEPVRWAVACSLRFELGLLVVGLGVGFALVRARDGVDVLLLPERRAETIPATGRLRSDPEPDDREVDGLGVGLAAEGAGTG